MTETRHTPGPWAVSDRLSIHSQELRRVENWICQAPNQGAITCPPREEQEANANLIAAAPDMLDALKEIVKEYPVSAGTAKGLVEDEKGYGPIRAAVYVIAKAEGRDT